MSQAGTTTTTRSWKPFGRDPALWVAVISATLSFIVTLGWDALSAEQAALIVAAINAVFGVVAALTVRPIAPVAFTALAAAVAALLGAYQFEVSQPTLGAINGFIIAVLALINREAVSPQQTALSRS